MEAGLYPRPEEAGAGSTGGGNRVLRCCCLGGAIRGPAVKRTTESHPGGGCPAQIPLEAVVTGLGWWGCFFFLRSRLVLASVVSRGAGCPPAFPPRLPPTPHRPQRPSDRWSLFTPRRYLIHRLKIALPAAKPGKREEGQPSGPAHGLGGSGFPQPAASPFPLLPHQQQPF